MSPGAFVQVKCPMCVCMHVGIHMYVCTHKLSVLCMLTYTSVLLCIFMHVHVCIYACVCVIHMPIFYSSAWHIPSLYSHSYFFWMHFVLYTNKVKLVTSQRRIILEYLRVSLLTLKSTFAYICLDDIV